MTVTFGIAVQAAGGLGQDELQDIADLARWNPGWSWPSEISGRLLRSFHPGG
ncbi:MULTISPECIES: hypothetical protein [Kribbella]|uniref:hypothetical protein n=1 Tax=Kribbella TaxID=182639 RepID=UPI002F696C41